MVVELENVKKTGSNLSFLRWKQVQAKISTFKPRLHNIPTVIHTNDGVHSTLDSSTKKTETEAEATHIDRYDLGNGIKTSQHTLKFNILEPFKMKKSIFKGFFRHHSRKMSIKRKSRSHRPTVRTI